MTDPIATTRAPTPVSYSIALQDLTVPQINQELNRLSNSERKLKETNAELSKDEHKDESFAQDAIAENEAVMKSYVWRREIIAYELRRRGLLSMPGVHESAGTPDPTATSAGDENGIEL